MFYGHRGNRNPFQPNNDRTISFSSLLDRRAQSEAKMNYAFNEDHASILFSKEALEQYNTIINTFVEKKDASSHRSGGYLKIDFSYDYPFERKRPSPVLILQPVGKKNAETIIDLSANDNGRILGPFPAGDYFASFGALTAIGKKFVPVTIENSETSELKCILTPDNIELDSALQSKDWTAGMPYEANFKIQSITLNGTGIHRKLHLPESENINIFDYTISRTDFYYKRNFFSTGCPLENMSSLFVYKAINPL